MQLINMLEPQYHEELRALRNLEKTIRACGLPTAMAPGQAQTEMLATALKDVVNARKLAIRKSRFTPFK
ncbi:hypothetical protein D3870_12035 [Noviherbaspirillum cavernae]|uniref:Uncharacterized protein n=2 Tax=Noviherbaspirillum cavernae TaxID=2320862 RepID=A0A418X2I1_9BURK|nr:hypothetical protein D3870_12035 [Noviherbaspirillum cavernae]